MIKIYGISHFSVVEYPKEYSIESIALQHENIIKRIEYQDGNANWHYDYIILDKKLEPCTIFRNGWSLSRFISMSAWVPAKIAISFKDPNNKTSWDYEFTIDSSKIFPVEVHAVSGLDSSGINSVLELFVNASNHDSWLDFLETIPGFKLISTR